MGVYQKRLEAVKGQEDVLNLDVNEMWAMLQGGMDELLRTMGLEVARGRQHWKKRIRRCVYSLPKQGSRLTC